MAAGIIESTKMEANGCLWLRAYIANRKEMEQHIFNDAKTKCFLWL